LREVSHRTGKSDAPARNKHGAFGTAGPPVPSMSVPFVISVTPVAVFIAWYPVRRLIRDWPAYAGVI